MRDKRRENIIRTSIGFLVAILIHLLIVMLFLLSSSKIFMSPPKNDGKKIMLDLTNFMPPPAVKPMPKPQPKPKPILPPIPIPEPQPKKPIEPKLQPKKKIIEEKKRFVAKKDNEENNITKKSKIVKKEELKKKIPKKKIIKKEIVKKEKPKREKVVKKKIVQPKVPKIKTVQRRSPPEKAAPRQKSLLGNALMGSGRSTSLQRPSSRNRKVVSRATKNIIKKLYGSEFDSYGPAQKRFIENNLAIIHKLTQGILSRNGYPEIAARTGQHGVNIVSFYLHPNGNISRLRLEQEMGYTALDQNTLQVIRIAYKDYPLPRTKTKIKFYVEYTIY